MHRTRRPRGEHGAAAVEFALVMVPLLALVFGIMQYGLYFWAMQGGADAARQASRLASVGNPATCADLKTRISGAVEPVSSATNGLQVFRTFTNPDGSKVPAASAVDVGDTVTVVVRFKTYDLNLPFVPFIEDGWVEAEAVSRVDFVPTPPDRLCDAPTPTP